MPKGFSEDERATIRNNLLAHGRARLVAVGMSKISVEELAHAAHISKGAFYQFFPSKEALFITLFEEAEANCDDALRALVVQSGGTAHQRLGHFLRQSLIIIRHEPLLGHFTRSDLETLLQGASPDLLQRNLSSDAMFYDELIELWRRNGIELACSPVELSGIVQMLYVASLYADDFEAHYHAAIDFMIEAVVDRLVAASSRGVVAL